MKPIKTDETVIEFTSVEEGIKPLPAYVSEDDAVCSVWELDAGELASLAQGGRILLEVWQHPPPPVALNVVGPKGAEWSSELGTWVTPVVEGDSETP